jgi:hypothetical protein
MADLRIDHTVLHGIGISLSAIADEFEDMHRRREVETRIWGGSGIRARMDDFASNWDRHREELTGSIRKLGQNCTAVADTFQSVDRALSTGSGEVPR